MSTRKHTPRTRGFRPEANDLESRQMLSAVVSGMDSKGDNWTLRLTGPGSLSVVKQVDATGSPAALNSATDIASIVVGGTDPLKSRIVGTVRPAAGSDGRVFFQTMNGLPARSEKYNTSGLGLLSIDMPGFWLGNTTPGAKTATTPAPSITLPDGVESLRFGGVDTTFDRPAATSTTTSDMATVALGLPTFGGTRIVIDRSVSSTQQAPPAAGSTAAATTVQHGVLFAVAGRLTLFQANSIEGDASHPPGPFANENPNASGTGGTTVVSAVAGTPPFFPSTVPFKGAGITGAIGDVRVGGNATNFATLVNDATGSGNDRIANFSVGGETNNVLLVAPNGSRNVVFGKGMDTVEIRSHVINTLKANRGALNSNVYVDRSISRVDLGGDAVNTTVLAGYAQSYGSIFTAITGQSSSPFAGNQPAAPPKPENAQPFGGMTVHVAGDVSNSVFAASVEPFNNVFGSPNQLVLSGGHIRGKIEGHVDNSTATPDTPARAFFAQRVDALNGPVFPPGVPEAPFTGRQHTALPGITPNRGTPLTATDGGPGTNVSRFSPATAAHPAVTHGAVTHGAVTHGAVTPKGPTASKAASGH